MATSPGHKREDSEPGSPSVSFEFFPPRSARADSRLDDTAAELADLGPAFLSVTCGAGGSGGEATPATVERLNRRLTVPIAAHLTCLSASRAQIGARARAYRDMGIERIVALRGDPPSKGSRVRPDPAAYECAASLVAALREIHPFDISVAGYPETHPEATSAAEEMAYLRRKVDAGASRVITQVFFDNEDFLRFRDRAAAAGITVPIVPGILPINDFDKVARFCRSCGTRVPEWLADRFRGLDPQNPTARMVGAATAAAQCLELRAHGVDSFHFYTMNQPEPTRAVCRTLGLQPHGRAAATADHDATRVA